MGWVASKEGDHLEGMIVHNRLGRTIQTGLNKKKELKMDWKKELKKEKKWKMD